MSVDIIVQVFLFGIALSMDAFAVSITSGLTYRDINIKKSLFIAITFGVMQALMPLIGYWLVEGISQIVGTAGGETAGNIMSLIVTWLAFILILLIGGKMLFEAIVNIKQPESKKEQCLFSVKEVLYLGVITAIDALATGVAFHSETSTNSTIWLHVSIIMVCTFIISLIGVWLAKGISKLLKNKHEITGIIGGSILIILAFWIIISHYIG